MSKIPLFVSEKRAEYIRSAVLALCGQLGRALVHSLGKLEGEAAAAKVLEYQSTVRYTLVTKLEVMNEQYEAVHGPAAESFRKMKEAAGGNVAPGVAKAHFAKSDALKSDRDAAQRELGDFEARLADLDRLEAQIVARQAKREQAAG